MGAAIKVEAGLGGRAWAMAGVVGLAGMALGWTLGAAGQRAAGDAPADGAVAPAPHVGLAARGAQPDAAWTTLFQGAGGPAAGADGGASPQPALAAPGLGGCLERPGMGQTAGAEATERNAVLNAILGQPEGAPLGDAELAQRGPSALLAMVHNPQADADARIEAAFAMQTYFDAPLPAPAVRQVLDAAMNQRDPLLQQDALDLLAGRMQPEWVPAVSAFLRAPDEATREMAIQRLSELQQDSQARAALAQAAEQDPSDVLRYLAAHRRE